MFKITTSTNMLLTAVNERKQEQGTEQNILLLVDSSRAATGSSQRLSYDIQRSM
jgi:hypothetical protein